MKKSLHSITFISFLFLAITCHADFIETSCDNSKIQFCMFENNLPRTDHDLKCYTDKLLVVSLKTFETFFNSDRRYSSSSIPSAIEKGKLILDMEEYMYSNNNYTSRSVYAFQHEVLSLYLFINPDLSPEEAINQFKSIFNRF